MIMVVLSLPSFVTTLIAHAIGRVYLHPSHMLLPLAAYATWALLMGIAPQRKMLGNLFIDPFLLAIAAPALFLVLAKYPMSAKYHDHVHARFAIPFGFTLGAVVFAIVPALGEC
jgi:hypothetical protein